MVAGPPLNLVFEGDSLTDNSPNGIRWPNVTAELLRLAGYAATATVSAVSGSTMDGAGGSPSVASRAAADDALLVAGAANYAFLLIGVNDFMAHGTSLATLEANVAAWKAAREAAGWTVVLITYPGAWGDDASRSTYNAWLRTQTTRIVDLEADPDIGLRANYVQPWSYDQLHTSGIGNLVVGALAYAAFRSTVLALTDVPVVASFLPVAGSSGTSLSIHGDGFTGATAVTVGGVAASFTVNSDSQITATVPVTTSGQVVVTTPGGSSTSVLTFTYT